MKFADLRLSAPILRAVAAEGYSVATPIQTKAIPPVLEGRDLLGCAQTGTGKTAAFALPILHRLSEASHGATGHRRIRCLVLCPTRELASQIGESFTAYGRHLLLRNTVIFGGVGQNPQVRALRSGVDILVATPGRLLDLMGQGHVDLRGIEVLVLDEADRMLDMGFIHDMRRIFAKLPAQRQTLLFSATIPAEIQDLAGSLLRNPVTIRVTPTVATVDKVEEAVYFVEKRNKPFLLAHLVDNLPMMRAIVFTRTKHGADKVVRYLCKSGIRAEAIHGNKSQNNRERALDNFRGNKTPVLVATDIASRGIDVDSITHVVNYDITHEPETYVHRIGRTARAGASGTAIAFCDREELPDLKAIEKLLRRPIPVCKDHPVYPAQSEADRSADRAPRRGNGESSHRSSDRHSRKPFSRSRNDRPAHATRNERPAQAAERPAHSAAGERPATTTPVEQPRHAAAHRTGESPKQPPRKAAPYAGRVRSSRRHRGSVSRAGAR